MTKEKKSKSNKLSELETKCAEYLNGWKRAQADYENLKKETDKKVRDLVEYSQANMILGILPIYDHFKLALSHIPENQKKEEWVKGILHIKKQFADFLKSLDIEGIKTVGEEFDPEIHEAVAREESKEANNQIIKEIKPGYMVKEKVLQPAQVVVSKKE